MADATGISDEEWAVWRAYLAMEGQLSRQIERQLQADAGISSPDYGTMAAILESPERRLRVGELAELLGWERSRVSHHVARMEKRGLVQRAECADDARATDVTLTAAGRRTILAAVRGHTEELRTRFLDLLEPDEREVLRSVFTRVVDRLNPEYAELSARVVPGARGRPESSARSGR